MHAFFLLTTMNMNEHSISTLILCDLCLMSHAPDDGARCGSSRTEDLPDTPVFGCTGTERPDPFELLISMHI